jgi:hypothetical protein
MARAIIRCSLNDDTGSVVRNVIVEKLEEASFTRIGTFAYEVRGADTADVLRKLSRVMALLANPPGSGRLDHLWIYLDQPD